MEDRERRWLQASIGIRDDMADEFLELLATDDEFRERLAHHPVPTLADYYIELPEDALPDTIELPSKADAAEFLDQTRKRHAAYGGGGPHPHPPPPGPVLGFAILYCVLGGVPLPEPPPPPPPGDES